MVERVNIMEKNWDYLVILDACRYDYFSELHQDFLHGELRKIISLGSSTLEWCKKSFQRVYNDVIYISANPYINSKDKVKGFKASDHFYKVIDVWDWGWDEEFGTILPERVNGVVQSVKNNYPGKRLIIHYLQPHAPYLDRQPQASGFPKPQIHRGRPLVGVQNAQNHRFLEAVLAKLIAIVIKPITRIRSLHAGNLLWRICESLDLPPVSPMDALRRKLGCNGLRQAYTRNLKIVLEHVAKLVDNLSGVVVITADHGEYLGEGGKYSHFGGCLEPILLEVPWLVVEKTARRKHYQGREEKNTHISETYTSEKPDKQRKEKIENRLRKLGYL